MRRKLFNYEQGICLVLYTSSKNLFSSLLSVEIQSSDHLHYFSHSLTLDFSSVKKKKMFTLNEEILMGCLWWYALSENVQKTPYATIGFT